MDFAELVDEESIRHNVTSNITDKLDIYGSAEQESTNDIAGCRRQSWRNKMTVSRYMRNPDSVAEKREWKLPL